LSNPGKPVLIPRFPEALSAFTCSKYTIAESISIASMSRIADVFFFSSEVFVIICSSAVTP
jgi:hypothetical protein